MKQTRRTVLGALAGLGSLVGLPARAATRTPSATEGPFYPTASMRFADTDNDLVKIASVVQQAGGEVVYLQGRVLDRAGKPVAGARVEIWQCDVNGRYLHTGDTDDGGSRPRDPAFQGFGHDITDANGGYTFRTIRPVSYPGRTPHIHVKVKMGRIERTSQFYLAGHPQNMRDFLYNNMSRAERKSVEMDFRTVEGRKLATVDIRL